MKYRKIAIHFIGDQRWHVTVPFDSNWSRYFLCCRTHLMSAPVADAVSVPKKANSSVALNSVTSTNKYCHLHCVHHIGNLFCAAQNTENYRNSFFLLSSFLTLHPFSLQWRLLKKILKRVFLPRSAHGTVCNIFLLLFTPFWNLNVCSNFTIHVLSTHYSIWLQG